MKMKAAYLLLVFFSSSLAKTAYLIGMCICAVRSYFTFHSHNLYLSLSPYIYILCGYILLRAHRSVSAISNSMEHLCKMLKVSDSKHPYSHIFTPCRIFICDTRLCMTLLMCRNRYRSVFVLVYVCVSIYSDRW